MPLIQYVGHGLSEWHNGKPITHAVNALLSQSNQVEDIWYAPDSRIKPRMSYQYAEGINFWKGDWDENKWGFKLEIYKSPNRTGDPAWQLVKQGWKFFNDNWITTDKGAGAFDLGTFAVDFEAQRWKFVIVAKYESKGWGLFGGNWKEKSRAQAEYYVKMLSQPEQPQRTLQVSLNDIPNQDVTNSSATIVVAGKVTGSDGAVVAGATVEVFINGPRASSQSWVGTETTSAGGDYSHSHNIDRGARNLGTWTVKVRAVKEGYSPSDPVSDQFKVTASRQIPA